MKAKDIVVGEAYAVGPSRIYGQARAVVLAIDVEQPVMRWGRATSCTEGGYVQVKWDNPSPWMPEDGVTLVKPREVQMPWAEFEEQQNVDRVQRDKAAQDHAQRKAAARAQVDALNEAFDITADLCEPTRGWFEVRLTLEDAAVLVERLNAERA